MEIDLAYFFRRPLELGRHRSVASVGARGFDPNWMFGACRASTSPWCPDWKGRSSIKCRGRRRWKKAFKAMRRSLLVIGEWKLKDVMLRFRSIPRANRWLSWLRALNSLSFLLNSLSFFSFPFMGNGMKRDELGWTGMKVGLELTIFWGLVVVGVGRDSCCAGQTQGILGYWWQCLLDCLGHPS